MMDKTFTIHLAGVDIAINPLHEYIGEYCQAYRSDGAPAFAVTIDQADIDAERRKSEREDQLEGIPNRQFSDEYLETLAAYRKITAELLKRDILLLHGSCIAVDGVAYLFTAKSGTGKSTHVKFWCEHFGKRAVVINDDKPLLAVTDAGVIAYGTPWDGKHRLSSNTSAPLKTICILERSETNVIRRVPVQDAYVALLQQVNRPKEPLTMAKTLQLLDRMLSKIEIYRLGCNMSPEAALVSYRGMNGGVNHEVEE